MRAKNAQVVQVAEVAADALRWIAEAAVSAEGGATWPVTRAVGSARCDDLYDGTAGVLVAFAEARLSGIAGYDQPAHAAAGRLRHLASTTGRVGAMTAGAASARPAQGPDLTLYGGLSGVAAALRTWANATGDQISRQAASRLLVEISTIDQPDRGMRVCDLIEGDAGVLVTLVRLGSAAVRPGAAALADQIVADARWVDGQPDWTAAPEHTVSKPNFSHGAAGIAFALAAASGPLGRPDLLTIAERAASRLVRLGTRPDGTLTVPYSLPAAAGQDPAADVDADIDSGPGSGTGTEVSYGWCHGPTGTMRLFQLLDQLHPTAGWAAQVDACRRAVRSSGLPTRLYPGFWDNLGRCCGTAGVGEMALDAYQETGDRKWLDWAGELAADVLSRRITDRLGTRWSNTEHRARPPELEPMTGWMQGTAGIAGWLLRLARVYQDGPGARRIAWPDHYART